MSEEKVIIDLCSSEEDVSGDENNYDETEEEAEEDTNSSEDDSDWSHDHDYDATESDVEADETGEKDDDDEDDKVTRLLTAGSDLKSVNVKECKAYLRKHGLRLSGTKPVCIDRIVEHWRIKDGSGEAVYPRASFAINCKGDVCKGDIVLFTQKVHHKYEKMKRSGNIMGRRTVAGQVVKESYGTAKQQHTFTIEVLWCEGTQKLPPLYPLLVKGRNLYRLMTLRQRWPNEEDRVKVLNEKHNRGAAARKVMRERKIKSGYVLKDGRLQKPGHVKKPCQVKTRKNEKDENLTQRLRQNAPANHSLVAFPNQNPSQGHKNPTQLRNMNPPHSYAPRSHAPPTYAPRPHAPLTYAPINSHLPRPNIPPYHPYTYPTQQNQTNQRPPPASYTYPTQQNQRPPPASYTYPTQQNQTNQRPPPASYTYSTQQNQTNQRPPPAFYNRRPASNALQGQASFNPHANTHAVPITHQRRPYQNHHVGSNSGYNLGVRDLDHFSHMMISHRAEGDTYRQSEVSQGPYMNHQTYHSNFSSGYNHGARDLYMVNHGREGDNLRPNYR
ncbi:predicted protein [Arabidopsis lyrata subsp. lyrata]|uniref:Predicted protein n=1 Tax=Arabidopsis lyrata subsp. lyrata TaxID=81972 RepID=D7MLX2_ARALL|nr:zinc finger CCCH domain-containing protein 62 [Arabidopsis lyrata subsp. lyrata]EFH41307.1 predicted protein [Arabidopsis lyrata subsp. lyrata]|eukprot:XP_002865048.1 zinc finger CCCH domain-containing protein 62 [Arabidopsis lyrata subsp. lyrata]